MLIDDILPVWHKRERHRLRTDVSAANLLRAAEDLTWDEVAVFRNLMRLRAGGRRMHDRPHRHDPHGFTELVRDRTIVYGESAVRGVRRAPQFCRWTVVLVDFDQPGCKIGMNFRADSGQLTTETRIYLTDAAARRSFAPLARGRPSWLDPARMAREAKAAISERAPRGLTPCTGTHGRPRPLPTMANGAIWCAALTPSPPRSSAVCGRPPTLTSVLPRRGNARSPCLPTPCRIETGAVRSGQLLIPDLAPFGFEVLFDAEWIYLEPSPHDAGSLLWTVAENLSLWPGLPPTLKDPSVVALVGRAGDEIVAGVVANRSSDVVGLSNLVVLNAEPDDVWAGAVAAVSTRYAGLALVGYESGASLDAAHRAGFVSVGPLRIWLASSSAP